MSDNEPIIVTPALPGYLMIAEIAQLAGVNKSTIHNYRTTGAASFPRSSQRAGGTPLWTVESIIEWLGSRPMSPTKVVLREDGSLEVVKSSDYKERRAAGLPLARKPD